MEELRKNAVQLALVGFGMYSVGCTLISCVIATKKVDDGNLYVCNQEFVESIGNPLMAFVLEMFVTGVFGAVVMAGIAVYEIESWSILRATATHYVLWMVTYFPVAFFLRWLSINEVVTNLMFLLLFTALYFMVWIISYISYKAEIKEINAELINLKKTENENAT